MTQVPEGWARITGKVVTQMGSPVDARLSVAPTSHPSTVTLDDGTVVIAGNAFVRADDAGRVAVDVLVGKSMPVEVVLSSPGKTIGRRTAVLVSGKEYEIHSLLTYGSNDKPAPGGLSIKVNDDKTRATIDGISSDATVITL